MGYVIVSVAVFLLAGCATCREQLIYRPAVSLSDVEARAPDGSRWLLTHVHPDLALKAGDCVRASPALCFELQPRPGRTIRLNDFAVTFAPAQGLPLHRATVSELSYRIYTRRGHGGTMEPLSEPEITVSGPVASNSEFVTHNAEQFRYTFAASLPFIGTVDLLNNPTRWRGYAFEVSIPPGTPDTFAAILSPIMVDDTKLKPLSMRFQKLPGQVCGAGP